MIISYFLEKALVKALTQSEHISANIESIGISGSISHMDELKSLDFLCCTHFPCLKELNCETIGYQDQSTNPKQWQALGKLFKNSPNIEILTLPVIDSDFPGFSLRNLKYLDFVCNDSDTGTLNIFDKLFKSIGAYRNLKTLVMDCFDLEEEHLQMLYDKLSLHRFEMIYPPSSSPDLSTFIANVLKEVVIFKPCNAITSQELLAIANSCTLLEELDLTYTEDSHLDDDPSSIEFDCDAFCEVLRRCRRLKSLAICIPENSAPVDRVVIDIVTIRPDLQELEIRNSHFISDTTLELLTKSMTMLKVLKLLPFWKSMEFKDKHVYLLAENMIHLRKLSVDCKSSVSNEPSSF